MTPVLLDKIRNGLNLSFKEQLILIFKLSLPPVLAQLSSILMTFIDSSMIGQHLGKNEAASIGLVSSSTWLVCGFCFACAMGFTVQAAHLIGAKRDEEARNLVKVSMLVCSGFVTVLFLLCLFISPFLPVWLGGGQEIYDDAYLYFLIFVCSLPVIQFNNLAAGMLQCSGDMKFPAIMQVVMAVLNISLNYLCIYILEMGVRGAAIATLVARGFTTSALLVYMLFFCKNLKLRKGERFFVKREYLIKASKIGIPVAFEQILLSGGQVAFTKVVAGLKDTVALSANSFAITVESVCYMPAYGLGAAATTLTGQCYGAQRKDLAYRLGWLTTILGMILMVIMGGIMFVFSRELMGFISRDSEIIALGAKVLIIEAFCEPLYGASLVSNGAFRGTGDTFIPSCFKFFSMWLIRIPLAVFILLRTEYGLEGIWFAMSFELCLRGILFLGRLAGRKWVR